MRLANGSIGLYRPIVRYTTGLTGRARQDVFGYEPVVGVPNAGTSPSRSSCLVIGREQVEAQRTDQVWDPPELDARNVSALTPDLCSSMSRSRNTNF